MASETADGEREDGREDAGFEEEDEREGGDAAFAAGAHGRRDEDYDAGHEDHEHQSRLDDHHAACGSEAADREETLADGVAVGALGVGDVGALDGVFDELGRHAYLGADIAELCDDAEEELVLFAHRFVDVACEAGALLGLEGHVCVCDFWDRGEEEHDGEEKDEGRDAEVGPLNVGEVLRVGVFEEYARCEKGRHDRADCLEGLRDLETEFR